MFNRNKETIYLTLIMKVEINNLNQKVPVEGTEQLIFSTKTDGYYVFNDILNNNQYFFINDSEVKNGEYAVIKAERTRLSKKEALERMKTKSNRLTKKRSLKGQY